MTTKRAARNKVHVFDDKFLGLNITKTKELVTDFIRKQRVEVALIN